MNGRVAAVVVTCNASGWIDQCLKSLLGSTDPVDVVVVDNASTDDTVDRVQRIAAGAGGSVASDPADGEHTDGEMASGETASEHTDSEMASGETASGDYNALASPAGPAPRVDLMESRENIGFGRANNRGIRRALQRGSEHVFLLNQDATVAPETIGRLVELQRKHPEYGVLSPMHLNGEGTALDAKFCRYSLQPSACDGLLDELVLRPGSDAVIPVGFVNAAAWLISRHCLEAIGGFHPAFFMYGEDDEFLIRARRHGFPAGVCPTAFIRHYRSQQSPEGVEQERSAYLDEQFTSNRVRQILIDASPVQKHQSSIKNSRSSAQNSQSPEQTHRPQNQLRQLPAQKRQLRLLQMRILLWSLYYRRPATGLRLIRRCRRLARQVRGSAADDAAMHDLWGNNQHQTDANSNLTRKH